MHNYLWLSDYLITQMKRTHFNSKTKNAKRGDALRFDGYKKQRLTLPLEDLPLTAFSVAAAWTPPAFRGQFPALRPCA